MAQASKSRRTVVIGASSGLGRCIAIGLAQRGARIALLARRLKQLQTAAKEAGGNAFALACDVTDGDSCQAAISEAAETLGGIDAFIYTPAIAPLASLVDTDATSWRHVFDTNVVGAALATSAALPYLTKTRGRAVYLSSVTASMTPPWPGLGAYGVSKAALDKLVETWQAEQPTVAFTNLVVGDCAGGIGDSSTGFADEWDQDLAAELVSQWLAGNYMTGSMIDVDDLVSVVDSLLRSGASVSLPTVVVTPRPVHLDDG